MDTNNEEGWVKVYRKLLEHPVIKDPEALQVLIYCLLKANHKPARILFNRQEVSLERGQFIFGLHQACKDLKMPIRKMRHRLILLQNIGILSRKTSNRFSIITVCNYSHYQDSENDKRQAKRQSDVNQTSTNKNDKNEKNKRIGRSSKDSDPRVKEFFDYWKEIFQNETGSPYAFSYGKEGDLIKDLLKYHSLETLQNVTRTFFRDEEAKRRGRDIGIFRLMFSRLVSKKGLDPLEQARREMSVM